MNPSAQHHSRRGSKLKIKPRSNSNARCNNNKHKIPALQANGICRISATKLTSAQLYAVLQSDDQVARPVNLSKTYNWFTQFSNIAPSAVAFILYLKVPGSPPNTIQYGASANSKKNDKTINSGVDE